MYFGEEATLLALSYNQEDRWKRYSSELSFEISCTIFFFLTTSSNECSLVSDLTEEETNPPNIYIDSI
jgi:hypothetical protein